MFKTQLLISGLVLLSFVAYTQQVKQPYYYQSVNNQDKTIDFVFGLYPATINYYESKDFPPYTAIRTAVFNKSKKDTLKWNNFKVDILLKSGQLISNYIPFSKENAYICTYKVIADSTHYQYFCFHTKFSNGDIDRAWLQISEDEIFSLNYEKNE